MERVWIGVGVCVVAGKRVGRRVWVVEGLRWCWWCWWCKRLITYTSRCVRVIILQIPWESTTSFFAVSNHSLACAPTAIKHNVCPRGYVPRVLFRTTLLP